MPWFPVMSTTLNYTKSSRRSRGFTLLEVLIAVFILSLVVSTVYAAYRGTFTVVHDTSDDREAYSMARNTMQRLWQDLNSVAASGGKYKLVSRASQVAGTNLTDLDFLAVAHLPFAE